MYKINKKNNVNINILNKNYYPNVPRQKLIYIYKLFVFLITFF